MQQDFAVGSAFNSPAHQNHTKTLDYSDVWLDFVPGAVCGFMSLLHDNGKVMQCSIQPGLKPVANRQHRVVVDQLHTQVVCLRIHSSIAHIRSRKSLRWRLVTALPSVQVNYSCFLTPVLVWSQCWMEASWLEDTVFNVSACSPGSCSSTTIPHLHTNNFFFSGDTCPPITYSSFRQLNS